MAALSPLDYEPQHICIMFNKYCGASVSGLIDTVPRTAAIDRIPQNRRPIRYDDVRTRGRRCGEIGCAFLDLRYC